MLYKIILANGGAMTQWGAHAYRVGTEENLDIQDPTTPESIKTQKKHIEPWLSAVFQSEHLGLLIGSGFTTAVALQAGAKATDMNCDYTGFPYTAEIEAAAIQSAQAAGRGNPNIEDQIRTATSLASGLKILGNGDEYKQTKEAINLLLAKFIYSIAKTEKDIREAVEALSGRTPEAKSTSPEEAWKSIEPLVMLVSFLLSFSSRTATRERLHIFTTNYDRLIEYGGDLAGLHILDRFVGSLEPIFRSSRLDIDVHYNPPGIRGEPRYLEGVVRLTKLHGSLDWVYNNGFVRKVGLPFGAEEGHPAFVQAPLNSVMIYPNAAKDRETSEYPYVELFRDYSAAICRPNSALVVYGYGFGDEHINRTIMDMLTIPSTHLVIIAHGDADGRIQNFCNIVGRKSQISLLYGPHFGYMPALVEYYLPKPAIDKITMRQVELLKNRGWEHPQPGQDDSSNNDGADQ